MVEAEDCSAVLSLQDAGAHLEEENCRLRRILHGVLELLLPEVVPV